MTMQWRGEEAIRLAQQAAMEGLLDGADLILHEAVNEAPLDKGTLRMSGTITIGGLPDPDAVYEAAESGRSMNNVVEEVGREPAVYVSFNTPYAIVQHENLSLNHKVGKAKYLEDPYKRLIGEVNKLVAQNIRKALR